MSELPLLKQWELFEVGWSPERGSDYPETRAGLARDVSDSVDEWMMRLALVLAQLLLLSRPPGVVLAKLCDRRQVWPPRRSPGLAPTPKSCRPSD